MVEPGRALVIGGSMSGLFAAHMLRQQGWDVDVFERVEELADRGAGIVAQIEISKAFDRIGIDFGENIGVSTIPRRSFDRDGRMIEEIVCPQTHTAWARVYRLLRDAFPPQHYHRGRRLLRVEQDANSVTAYFEDGEVLTADLLVGADGLRSTVRSQFLPDAQPLYSGYSAWRALVNESAISPKTHNEIYLCMAFHVPPGEQILGYPVAGPNDDLRPGHRRYNWIWYRPAEENTKLKDLLTDENGVTHVGAIPPPLIRKSLIEEMRADARRLLPPQFQEVINLAEQPFLQTIYDFETPQMAFGRVAIVGDAAFVARPHVAAGVAKAAEDCMALADALATESTVEDALKALEARRLPIGRKIVRRGRVLGAYIQPERKTEEERENARLHSGMDRVIREIALVDFLYEPD